MVIGFDARQHTPSASSSKRFASLAAAVFVSRGVPVHLFSVFTPTPYVVRILGTFLFFIIKMKVVQDLRYAHLSPQPFTVSRLGLCAGIMVTASHNPKQDNGYKVRPGV